MLHDVILFLNGIGKTPYFVFGLYLFLAGTYGILWYFKRPVIKNLRKVEFCEHMVIGLLALTFATLISFIIFVPQNTNPGVYTEQIITAYPYMVNGVVLIHMSFFVVLWLKHIRTKIPGDI